MMALSASPAGVRAGVLRGRYKKSERLDEPAAGTAVHRLFGRIPLHRKRLRTGQARSFCIDAIADLILGCRNSDRR
jgi:hypothetical protein